MAETLIAIDGLKAWYGESQVLHGVTLDIRAGELVTLIGRNGAGKTTTLRALLGLIRREAVRLDIVGSDARQLPPHRIARLGIGYVPEERGIFSSLTVEENLLLPPVLQPGGPSAEEIYALFPHLAARRRNPGARLSGGEQQMLAIARVLRTGARLILLDEPTEGLAPVIVQQIGELVRQLKARGITLLMVEQNFRFAAALADRHYVMEDGRVVDMIEGSELDAEAGRIAQYLAV